MCGIHKLSLRKFFYKLIMYLLKTVPKIISFFVYNNDRGRERRYARMCFSRFKY